MLHTFEMYIRSLVAIASSKDLQLRRLEDRKSCISQKSTTLAIA